VDVEDPLTTIVAGRVLVDGRIVTNPRSLVRSEAAIVVRDPKVLRGEAKLRAALARLDVRVAGRVGLDLGAAAGGFTRALLAAGVRRVYAVDAGHGQLLGSLRQDVRVINLEGVNLGSLERRLVPDTVDLVTMDLSYLAVAAAVPQLDRVVLASDAELLALVKPMFELRLDHAPRDARTVREALECAAGGVEGAGWRVCGHLDSPVRGAGGAVEVFLHARRASRDWRSAG
jgi:23S rRNA (cytidine1920-2'-O)/16S rRNA (cytidine1409-2'-O)-methyltransferase